MAPPQVQVLVAIAAQLKPNGIAAAAVVKFEVAQSTASLAAQQGRLFHRIREFAPAATAGYQDALTKKAPPISDAN